MTLKIVKMAKNIKIWSSLSDRIGNLVTVTLTCCRKPNSYWCISFVLKDILLKKMDPLSDCPIIGHYKEVSNRRLRTHLDMKETLFFVSKEIQIKGEKRISPNFKDVIPSVVERVKNIWVDASIPIIWDRKIIQMVKKDHDELYALKKSYQRDTNKFPYKQNLNSYLHDK